MIGSFVPASTTMPVTVTSAYADKLSNDIKAIMTNFFSLINLLNNYIKHTINISFLFLFPAITIYYRSESFLC